MKAYQKFLGLTLIGGIVAIPAYLGAEVTSSTPASELTLVDFLQRSTSKPSQAVVQYGQYKYRLTHPVPTLGISSMRKETGESTWTDFQRASKSSREMLQYKEYQYQRAHPLKRDTYKGTRFLTSTKPGVDWWKRQG